MSSAYAKKLRGIVLWALLLFLPALSWAALSAEAQRGLTWLESQVQADGRLINESVSIATPFQNRTETLHTLHLLATAPASLGSIVAGDVEDSTEYLARRVIVLSVTGQDVSAIISLLSARQNDDGGFGGAPDHASNPLDSAWVLLALKAAGSPNTAAIERVAVYLLSAQQPDGGFAMADNANHPYLVALASLALQVGPRVNPVLDAVSRANAWLLVRQGVDGGWGGPVETSVVYLALLGTTSDPGLQSRVSLYLVSQQQGDGSWSSDPFITALALRALTAKPRPLPTTGEVGGRVLDDATGQVLPGATATVTGGPSATSDAAGQFTLSNVAAGNQVVTISAQGYTSKSYNFTLVAGTVINLGDIRLAPAVSTGFLQGRVIEAVNGTPLQDVLISVTGSSTDSVLTAADGNFRLANLTPGVANVAASKAGYETITFNVTLVAGTVINVGDIRLAPAVNTGILQGRVTDAVNSAPLQGVLISVTGSSTASVLTGTDGNFRLVNLSPGAINVAASKVGYETIAGSGTLVAGGTLVFSPALPLAGSGGDPTVGTVVGRVVDAFSQAPLLGVVVTASADATTVSATTDAAGRFVIDRVPPQTYTVRFDATGYLTRSYTALVSARSTVDFQTVALDKLVNEVILTGQVSDAGSGLPIAGASVKIVGTAYATQTDANGIYRFTGLSVGDVVLGIGATGYVSETLIYSFALPGEYRVDRKLNPDRTSEVALTILGTDKASYQAYEGVDIQAVVVNSGAVTTSGGVSVAILDAQGKHIDSLQATWTDASGVVHSEFDFVPGTPVNIAISWNTGNYAPSSYTIIGKVSKGNGGTGGGTVVLAERLSAFGVTPTQAITSLVVTPLPRFTNLGATEQVSLQALAVNRSNVVTEINIAFEWRSPSGLVLRSGTSAISLLPGESSKSVTLETFPFTFAESGDHPVQIQVLSGPTPGSIRGDVIAAAPGTRIEPSQKITPTVVVPDGNKRIRVDIRLQGVEQK